jgi:anthranilate phosphoribosyltransferase
LIETIQKLEGKVVIMIQKAIKEILSGNNLDFDTTREVMEEMMDGRATQAQMGALLTGLRMKGETVEEITACATVMREKGLKINPVRNVIDIVGTGGDGVGTFNISTTSAFVIAAGGVPVAKHGNRGVSSKSGAADVLEKLGINLDLTPSRNEEILEQSNICFMFAPIYHSSMKYAAPVRKEMGVRTIFNILGPLASPAGAKMQLMGVYDEKLIEPLANVLSNLGVYRGLVVNGSDGMDEVTLTGETHVCEIRFGVLTRYDITPEQFGLKRCEITDLAGGSPADNAEITKNILCGIEKGPKRDVVVMNSAMALYLGIDNCTVQDCIKLAEELIDSGKAASKLEEFRKLTNEVKE